MNHNHAAHKRVNCVWPANRVLLNRALTECQEVLANAL
jgi:hypothetical protein